MVWPNVRNDREAQLSQQEQLPGGFALLLRREGPVTHHPAQTKKLEELIFLVQLTATQEVQDAKMIILIESGLQVRSGTHCGYHTFI